MKKILVTQRVEKIKKLRENRDNLDIRMSKFLEKLSFLPIPVPNGIKNIDGVRNIEVICCLSPEKLFEQLINDISEGDRILFKASNSVKLKSLVEQICKYFS